MDNMMLINVTDSNHRRSSEQACFQFLSMYVVSRIQKCLLRALKTLGVCRSIVVLNERGLVDPCTSATSREAGLALLASGRRFVIKNCCLISSRVRGPGREQVPRTLLSHRSPCVLGPLMA
jgi:hypothetical protein